MTVVIEGKNGRDLTLPQPPRAATGRAISLAFLQTIATLIALWYAVTGGGKRFRRLTQKGAYERDLLEAAVSVLWRKGRFSSDNPLTAIRRLFHIVLTIAWHAEMRGRPDMRGPRRTHAADAGREAPVAAVAADDSS